MMHLGRVQVGARLLLGHIIVSAINSRLLATSLNFPGQKPDNWKSVAAGNSSTGSSSGPSWNSDGK